MQYLCLMVMGKPASGLYFDQDDLVDDQIGSVRANDDVVKYHVNPSFNLDVGLKHPKSMCHGPLIDGLKKSEAQIVINVEEGPQHFVRRHTLNQVHAVSRKISA